MAGKTDISSEAEANIEPDIDAPNEDFSLTDVFTTSAKDPHTVQKILDMATQNPELFISIVSRTIENLTINVEQKKKAEDYLNFILLVCEDIKNLERKLEALMEKLEDVNDKIINQTDSLVKNIEQEKEITCSMIKGVGAVCTPKEVEKLKAKQKTIEKNHQELKQCTEALKQKIKNNPDADITQNIDDIDRTISKLNETSATFSQEISKYIDRIQDPDEKINMQELLEEFKKLSEDRKELTTQLKENTAQRDEYLIEILKVQNDINTLKTEVSEITQSNSPEDLTIHLAINSELDQSAQSSVIRAAAERVLKLEEEINNLKAQSEEQINIQKELEATQRIIEKAIETGTSRSGFLRESWAEDASFHAQNAWNKVFGSDDTDFKENPEKYVTTDNGEVVFQHDNGSFYYFENNNENGKVVTITAKGNTKEFANYGAQGWQEKKYYGNDTPYGDKFIEGKGFWEVARGGKDLKISTKAFTDSLKTVSSQIEKDLQTLTEKTSLQQKTQQQLIESKDELEKSQKVLIASNNRATLDQSPNQLINNPNPIGLA